MKIKWFGHACFGITNDQGKVLVTDPYKHGCFNGAVKYPKVNIHADVVLSSHDHDDHNAFDEVNGDFVRINEPGLHEALGMKFKGVKCFHDESQGSERGENIIFVMDIDNMKIAHLGDLGHLLEDSQYAEIGNVDIMFIPVGGHFTIDGSNATKIMEKINPKITIPMHVKTDMIDFPIKPVDDFTQGKDNVKNIGASEAEISAEKLPDSNEIWVFDYAK